MISNYVFNKLSQDSVDSDAASVLPEYQKRYQEDNLVEADIPAFAYTSLKTLLGEVDSTSNADGIPNWAINRIRSGRSIHKFVNIEEPDNLPLVNIKVSSLREHPGSNKHGAIIANVEIQAIINPESVVSSSGWNIIYRIRSLFVTNGDITGREQPVDIANGVNGISGFTSLRLIESGHPEINWDLQRIQFLAEGQMVI